MATVLERITTKPRKFEAGTVHWFNECIERGKTEPFAPVVKVTPGLAEHILKFNPDNRKLRPVKQGHYATDISGGRWKLNGETIIIAKDGFLNDGQNRLVSVIEAQTPIDTFMVFGVERDTRITVDQGAARTAGDYLTMLGVAHGNQLAGIARLVMAYEADSGRSISKRRDFTNAQVVQRCLNDAELQEVAAYANHAARFTKGMAYPAIIGACLYILSDEDREDARDFIDQIAYGENIKRGDPAYAVRTALGNFEKEDRAARMEMIFRGWNAYRQHRQLTLAKALGSFPALV